MPIVTCEVCDREFSKNKFEINKTKKHFCSRECFGKHLSQTNAGVNNPRFNRVIKTCENCGKEFYAKPHEIKKGWGRFCSNQCKISFSRIERTCRQCHKNFYIAKNQVEAGGGKFCSKKCQSVWQSIYTPRKPVHIMHGKDHPNYSERVKSNCAQCGKVMYVTQWELSNNKKYCSMECYAKAQNKREKRSCAFCGKTIYVKLRKSRKNPEKSFCNLICMAKWNVGANNPSWRGGYEPYYGPNWSQQRRAARKRDKYTCQHCGKTERENGQELDVHHIVPRRKFNGNYKAANKLSNLITLCVHCHRKAEPKD